MHATSGKLAFADAKGMHLTTADWWIDTKLVCSAFRLLGFNGRLLAEMDQLGRLMVHPGYIWDGSSGPTIDGVADPVPSMVHDVLYEAMRARRLPQSMRKPADELYRALLRERGMGAWRAGFRYWGLRLVGGFAASPRKGPEYPNRTAA